MRCNQCGNRIPDGQEECPTCPVEVWALGLTEAPLPAPGTIMPKRDAYAACSGAVPRDLEQPHGREPQLMDQATSVLAEIPSVTDTILAYVIPPKRAVQGRVILVEPTYTEHADRDICRVITRALWICLLLVSPVLVLHWLFVSVGGLPALLALAGLVMLFRFASPTNLYAMLRIFSVLSPGSRETAQQVPVRYFRIREDGSENEVMVRMKGQFTHGNIGLDDLVTLTGRFRSGTLYALEGYNRRTASTIQLAQSYSWVGLALTVVVILAVAASFYEPAMRIGHTIQTLGGVR